MVIYADNAATTKLDIDAFEAMKPFLLDNYANPSGAYSFSKEAKQAIKSARSTIAECINAGRFRHRLFVPRLSDVHTSGRDKAG